MEENSTERCVNLVQKITCERQGGEQKHRHSTQSGARDREESRNIGTARSLVRETGRRAET